MIYPNRFDDLKLAVAHASELAAHFDKNVEVTFENNAVYTTNINEIKELDLKNINWENYAAQILISLNLNSELKGSTSYEIRFLPV